MQALFLLGANLLSAHGLFQALLRLPCSACAHWAFANIWPCWLVIWRSHSAERATPTPRFEDSCRWFIEPRTAYQRCLVIQSRCDCALLQIQNDREMVADVSYLIHHPTGFVSILFIEQALGA